MLNPFERFYDTTVEVYEDVGANTYGAEAEKRPLGELVCDLQPYSDLLESKLRGFDEEKRYKLYCDKTDLVTVGKYVLFGGGLYRIESVEVWSFGLTAVIRYTGGAL